MLLKTTGMQQPLAPNVWDVQQTSWSNNDMPPRECAREDSSVSNPRRCSQFTFRHLSQMASCIPSSPLRVVAHIDLDCFYAQVEMVRLGIAEDTPFAVQQW
jgi:Nucleotidyltransferase/DNA polymerase involved in DNA repair